MLSKHHVWYEWPQFFVGRMRVLRELGLTTNATRLPEVPFERRLVDPVRLALTESVHTPAMWIPAVEDSESRKMVAELNDDEPASF